MVEVVDLHASSLSDLNDCGRRQAARAFTLQIQNAGHYLPKNHPSVGAAMGTSLHSMMAELFRTKLAIGDIGWRDAEEAVDKVFPDFLIECYKQDEEVIWDQTTKNHEVAREQLLAMANAFLPIAEHIQPAKVEDELEWLVSPLGDYAIPVRLIGRRDVLDVRGEISDHKTGVSMPSPYEQMGCYSILGKYHDEDIRSVRVNYVPRQGIKSLRNLSARSFVLPIDECEKAAWNSIKRFQRQFMEYLETGDPHVFPANPKSMACSPDYCSAFCTTWCKVGKIQ